MVDLSTRSAKTAFATCLLTTTVCGYALIDWHYKVFSLHLEKFEAGLMQPAATVALLLAGICLALSLLASGRTDASARKLRLAARACAGVVFLMGLGLVAIHCGGWSPKDAAAVVGEEPGNPNAGWRFVTLNYAVNIFLLGAALLLADRDRRSVRLGVEIAVSLVTLDAAVALLGDFFGTGFYAASHGPGTITPCTALVLQALAGAVLLSHTDRGFLKDLTGDSAGSLLARRLLPAVLLGPLIVGWLARRAEQSHWCTSAGADAGQVVGDICILALLVCWNARSVIHADQRRRAAEASAHESEGRFAGAFDHAPIGVAIVAPTGEWLKVNPALCELVGYSAEEMLRGSYQDITHPDDCKLGQDEIRRMMAGEMRSYTLEKRYVHRDGRVLTVVIKASLVREDLGEPAYFVTQIQDITERKRAEEELRWKTAYLEAQINSSPDGILVVDAAGTQIHRNLHFDEMLRLEADNRPGGSDEETLRYTSEMMKDAVAFVDRIRYLYSHPDESGHDLLELRDGRYIERYSAPVIGHDGTHYGRIWNFRDITERKQTEQSLRESEARYLRIAANVPGMVYRFVVHADGRYSFRFVSEGCRVIFGLEPAEVLRDAHVLLDRVHPEDKADFEQSISTAAAAVQPWAWQGRFLRADSGETICIEAASRPERGPHGDNSWDGVIVDVTARKQAEEDRRAKEVAERAQRVQSQFLSRMSHELRTPLNAILGFGQVMELSQLGGQDATALGYILRGGRHLLSLVDEVLDLSRAEAGELRLTIDDVDADAVVTECVGLVDRLAAKRGVTCAVQNAQRFGRLRCDEQRLRQVLLNLLSNAIKYNRAGGQVLVSAERVARDRLRLRISDTGPGISPAGLARLFVPFERLEHESGEVEGTGLGLVVSRRIAEAMDGAVGVESDLGQGSTFWIELPRAATPSVPVVIAPAEGPAIAGPPVPCEVSLLYIEDNLSNLQLVEMALARQRPHWEFLSARNGLRGLEQAREHRPDLILLDLQMPGMSGEEVLKTLRREPSSREIPVVVLSADMTGPSRARLLAQGADAYVNKPFEMSSFLELLDATLERPRV